MKTLPSLTALLILAGFTTAGPAPATPAWKLKEGDVFYVRQTRKGEQKLKVQDSIIRHEITSTSVSQFKVLTKNEETLILRQKIESVTGSGEGEKAGVKDMLKALAGATFTFHLDKEFHITKVEGYDALMAKLAKGDAGLEKTARTLLPEAGFRDVARQLFDFVPAKPVAKGATWDSDTSETFGPWGALKVSTKWSLADEGAEGEAVKITGAQKLLLDTAAADKALPFRIKAGVIKKAEARVDVTFNQAKGRLQQCTANRKLHVQFLVEKDKRTLDMHIEQDSTMTLEVLDKSPIKS